MDALVGCLRRGMQSRDAMGWAGCNGRTPRGESRKVVVMHEGSSAIPQRPPEMRKPRLVVDVQDQLTSKAVSETLRARAYGRCQQLIYKLHAHLGLQSSAFLQGACLLLLLQPATPATTAHRRGARPEPNCIRNQPARSENLRGQLGDALKKMTSAPRFLAISAFSGHRSRVSFRFRSLLAKTLKFRQD